MSKHKSSQRTLERPAESQGMATYIRWMEDVSGSVTSGHAEFERALRSEHIVAVRLLDRLALIARDVAPIVGDRFPLNGSQSPMDTRSICLGSKNARDYDGQLSRSLLFVDHIGFFRVNYHPKIFQLVPGDWWSTVERYGTSMDVMDAGNHKLDTYVTNMMLRIRESISSQSSRIQSVIAKTKRYEDIIRSLEAVSR